MNETKIEETSIGWSMTSTTYRRLFWNFLYQDADLDDPDHPCVFKAGRRLFWRIWWVPDLGQELKRRAEASKFHCIHIGGYDDGTIK